MSERVNPVFGLGIGNADTVLDALIDHSEDCVKVLDLNGRVLKWNDACELYYGWGASEVLGKRLPHVPDALALRAVADIRAIAAAGRVVGREAEARRADGSGVTMKLVVTPLSDPDGHTFGVVTIARELSGEARLERLRADFASLIGRRIRDPLSSVASATQLLARPEMLNDRERALATLEAIGTRTRQVSQFVDEMLDLADLAETHTPIDREPIEMYGLLVEVLGRMGDAGSRVAVDVDPGIRPVLGDRPRIARAMASLIECAVTRAEGATVEVTLATTDSRVTLTVSEPLRDGRQASRIRPPGRDDLGFALALARRVAAVHNGGFKTASEPDSVRYSLHLPVTTDL